MHLGGLAGEVGVLTASVEETFLYLAPCGLDHGGGEVAEPKQFLRDVSLRHDAWTVGDQPSVEAVVETGPLGEGKGGALFRADKKYGVLGQIGIIEEGAYLAGESIEVVDLGVIRHECLAQLGGVDPVRWNGELGGIEQGAVARGVR